MQASRKKRGFTLTELTVVLAVMAIVATLTVTFSSLISKRRAESHATLEAMQDIAVAEETVEAWIKRNNVTAFTESDRLLAEGGASIEVSEGKLVIGGETVYSFERVTSITFKSEETNGNTIYYCSAAYTLPRSEEEMLYTFCVYKQAVTP